jgi:hypothetical protein
MRLSALVPLLVLAACSEGSAPTKAEEAEAPAAAQLGSGQWEMTTEVTKVTQRDQGTPLIKMAEGSKTTRSSCVAEAELKKPQPALFAPEKFECTHRDFYMSGGRVNATMACTYPGTTGEIATSVNGSYTGDTIEATTSTETLLTGQGDVRIDAKLTGRRTGACTAPAAAPAKS